MGDAWRVKLAVPRTDFVEESVAVTVIVVCVATLLGALYKPSVLSMLPVTGLIDQVAVTPEGRLRTENCCVVAGATVIVAGLTLGVGEACRVKLAVPRTACEEEFVAVTVIVVCVATLLGALYKPSVLSMLPVTGLIDQVAVTPEGRLRTENCCVAAGATVAVAGLTMGVGEAWRVKLAVPSAASVEGFFAVTVIVV